MTWTFPQISAVLCCLQLISTANAEDILQFGEAPIGYVTVSRAPSYEGESIQFDAKPMLCRKAVGRISMPESGYVGIELLGSKIADAKTLENLPQRIASVIVRDAKLSKEHIALLTQLRNLTSIEFRQCQFTSDAFDSASDLPGLKSFQLLHRGSLTELETSLAPWLVKQQNLERVWCDPALSSDALLQMAQLPKLKSYYATLDANAPATIAALKRLPSLDFLSIKVTPDCPRGALDSLGGLERLHRFRQFQGKASKSNLDSFAKAGRLTHLDLALVELEPDSLQTIAQIKSLEQLELLTHDRKSDALKDLASACAALPNLKHWPRLHHLSKEDLSLIVAHPAIERLSIGELDPSLDPKSLEQLVKLTRLRELSLSGMEVDDPWLEQISALKSLESLELFDTAVAGHGFRAFQDHANLQRVYVFVRGSDETDGEFDLTALADTNLKDLRLGGAFHGKSLSSLSKLKKLEELSLDGDFLGFSDDSLAQSLAQLPNLRSLSMTDNCFITDTGALELSKLETLQTLSVSGFVTEQGIEALSQIPSLKLLSVASSQVSSDFRQEIPRTTVSPFRGDIDERGIMPLGNAKPSRDGLLRKTLSNAESSELQKIQMLEGEPPPDFQAKALAEEKSFALEDYRGKVVIIDFWGTWCFPCRRQIPKLQSLYQAHRANGLEIISIHTTKGSEDLADFMAKKKLPWLQLVDQKDATAGKYHVPHYPSIYLIDRSGKLRVALAHPDGLEQTVTTLLKENP